MNVKRMLHLIIMLTITAGSAGLLAAAVAFTSPPSHIPADPLADNPIQPADLTYRGAFAYPSGGEWAYSGHALAYYPAGDPTGPADGYPGSLYIAGHVENDWVGEITIPEPIIADSFDDLPLATVLRPLADITGGWKDNCTYTDDCIYREVDGLEYLPNINKVVWNLRDWYNVGGYDQDSLGWSGIDMTGAQGVWHIGERANNVFHNAKTSNYLFTAPESFASQHLEGKWLIAGNHRQAGAFGGSQGPTLYALAPWEDGDPPVPGQNLDALALMYYREIYPGCLNDPGECDFPNYRPADTWEGGAWVQTADLRGILISGRKGLGDNCYGEPGVECGIDACNPYKGYHAYPYEPQILFYDPEKLEEVLAGTRQPWEVVPYVVYSPTDEVLGGECATLGDAAYDRERRLMYVAEREAGPWGETVVHVWSVPATAPTPTPTATPTASNTPPATSTPGATPTASNTPPATSTPTPTATPTASNTPPATSTPSATPTASNTPPATSTPTPTATLPATATFQDVPTSHWAWEYIERLYAASITGGCGVNPLIYCPEQSVTRDQMAIFLLRGIHLAEMPYTPPDPVGVFSDVPLDHWAARWIEQLYNEGITGGCLANPLMYCPSNPVTRGQMAIFLLRSEHGAGYSPPDASGTVFGDVPADYWAADWIEQLAAEGITGGCAANLYCPENAVNRAQMAVFLVRTFNLP